MTELTVNWFKLKDGKEKVLQSNRIRVEWRDEKKNAVGGTYHARMFHLKTAQWLPRVCYRKNLYNDDEQSTESPITIAHFARLKIEANPLMFELYLLLLSKTIGLEYDCEAFAIRVFTSLLNAGGKLRFEATGFAINLPPQHDPRDYVLTKQGYGSQWDKMDPQNGMLFIGVFSHCHLKSEPPIGVYLKIVSGTTVGSLMVASATSLEYYMTFERVGPPARALILYDLIFEIFERRTWIEFFDDHPRQRLGLHRACL